MQSLIDDERKDVLGEVLHDELKAIREYIQDVPAIKQELHQVHDKVDEINSSLTTVEQVIKVHNAEIKHLEQRLA